MLAHAAANDRIVLAEAGTGLWRRTALRSSASLAIMVAMTTVTPSLAQSIGPGTISSTATLNVPARTTTVVGNTTIAPTSSGTQGINISAGTVNVNPAPSAGPDQITTNNATALLVQGSGVTATVTPTTAIMVTANAGTAAADMSGVRAITGGSATLNGVTVETFGSNTGTTFASNALFANGASTQITATNSTLKTHGDNAFGANATNGTINLSGGGNSILTSGNTARGVFATGTGIITANSLSIATQGANANGAFALTGGQISLGASTNIQTMGDGAIGGEANGASTLLSIGTGGTITTRGLGAWGVAAVAAGRVDLTAGVLAVHTFGNAQGTSGAYGLLATGASTSITGGAVSIITEGSSADGAFADSGGRIQLGPATSIVTKGVAGVGALSNGPQSVFSIGANSTVTTSGDAGWGIAAVGGASADLTAGHVTITTNGATTAMTSGSFGLFATDRGSSINTATVDIETHGLGGVGAFANAGAQINLGASSVISTAGLSAHGIDSNGTDPSGNSSKMVVGAGVGVTTANNGAAGVLAVNAGVVDMTAGGDTVRTAGNLSIGLVSTRLTGGLALLVGAGVTAETQGAQAGGALAENGSSLILSTSLVTTHGVAAVGASATLGGLLTLSDTTVATTGPNATGVLASDPGSVATLTRTPVSSGQFDAGAVANSGTLLVTDSALRGSRHGIFASSGTQAQPNMVLISGGSLTATGDAFHAQDAAATFTVNRGADIHAGSGNILDVISTDPGTFASNVLLTAANVSLHGDLIADMGSIADVALVDSQLVGAVNGIRNLTIDPSSWEVTANSTLVGTLTNAGIITFDPPSGGAFKTVTTASYVGASGAINLNTFLGDDASPSDRLVINGGTATGASPIHIAKAGGGGALTTGNGILVVDALNGATTQPGMFTLASPVVAGPYEYSLFRSSADASNPNAWYLRSTFTCPFTQLGACPSPPSPPTPTPAGPPPPPSPPEPPEPFVVVIPHYRAEVSLYVALPSMAQLYGRALLDTLHERVGEEEDLRDRPSARSEFNGLWGRLIQWNGVRDGTNGGIYGNQGPQFNYDLFAFQVGTDVYAHQSTDGSRDHLGLMGSGGRIEATVTDFTGQSAGNDKINATSAGGYWTHYDRHAAYLDAVFQYTWYDATAASLRFPALEGNATGLAASLEAGKPFHFSDSKAWVLEPQLQGIYQHFDRDQTGDVAGLVTFNDTESFLGRAGLRLADRFADTGPGGHDYRVTLWGRVNLWHEFMDSPETLFATQAGAIPFTANPGKTWVETNAGATAQVSQRTTIFASLGYQWDTEGEGHAYNGKIGVRMNW